MILRTHLIFFTLLSVFLASFKVFAKPPASNDCLSRINEELESKLSPEASIVPYTSAVLRWSTYHAPRPGVVVNVAEENDVVETLKYCIENNLDFLVQSGGHGWATTFNIGQKDVLINMRGLNKVSVSDDKGTVTFQGGALVGEVLNATYQNQVETTTPTCNCVGMSGATLGGGLNRLVGHYGMVIDNLLSINLVTADGELRTITPSSSPDLWFALRGAGANFGVVTSVTMKAYPPINDGVGWSGSLVFTPDQLEDLVQALSDFEYTKEMYLTLYFRPSFPDFSPSIVLSLWYTGSETQARAAYKAFFDLGPVNDMSQEIQYNQFNAEADAVCFKGLRRPGYSDGLMKLDPETFRKVWEEYVSLVTQYPRFNGTSLLLETYSPEKVQTFPDSSSAFPHRNIKFQAIINAVYDDASLDPIAENFGEKVRQLWKESSGFEDLHVYINSAHGDEDPEAIYGDSLSRLKKIKKQWDRHGRFSQFFPIPI